MMLQMKESLPRELYFIPCNTAENGRNHVYWKILNESREVFQSRNGQERQCRTGNAGLHVPLFATRAA